MSRPARRRSAGAVVALGVLLTACGGSDVIRQQDGVGGGGAGPGGAAPGTDVHRDDLQVRQAGPRELVVSLVGAPAGDGPCESRLRAVVVETASEVRLSLVDDRPDSPADGGVVACPAIGYQWALPVTLEADLGARSVVTRDGRPLDVVAVPVPARLPEGYSAASESGGGGAHVLTYTSAGGGWLTVAVQEEPASAAVERAYPRVEEVVVDGRTFRLLENELQKVVAFELDGRQVRVSWMRQRVDSPATTTWDQLLDVAASVR